MVTLAQLYFQEEECCLIASRVVIGTSSGRIP